MSFELHRKVAGKMSGGEKASALFKRPSLDSIHTYIQMQHVHACRALAGHKCSLKGSELFHFSSVDPEQVFWPQPRSNRSYFSFRNMHISTLLEVYFPGLRPVATGNSQSPRAPKSLCEIQGEPDNLSA